jgi:hypothetical protein
MALCAIENPVTTPADSTIESTWPGYLRTFKQQVLDSFELEHTCAGKHMFGVDAGASANTYGVILDASMGPLLAAGLYAGLAVRMQVAHTNTGASNFLLAVGASQVGSTVSIKILGADPQPGQLVAGQIITLVYNGTIWECVSGYVITKYVLPPGTRVQIATTWTTNTPTANSAVPVTIATLSVLANSFSKLEFDVDVQLVPDVPTGRSSVVSLITDSVTSNQSISAVGPQTTIVRRRLIVAGGQTSTQSYVVQVQLSAAVGGFSAAVLNLSLVGIV